MSVPADSVEHMMSNEMRSTLEAIDQLDSTLDRIAALPLRTLRTDQKLALLAQLEALRRMLVPPPTAHPVAHRTVPTVHLGSVRPA